MKSTIRFFLKAVVVAVALSGAGYGYSQYQHSKTAALQSKCEAQGKKEMEAFNARGKDQTGPWTAYQSDPLVCDPHKLYTDLPYSETPPGVQGELVTAYRDELNDGEQLLYGLAFLILFVGILPAGWYFLLARLGEVAAAIRRS